VRKKLKLIEIMVEGVRLWDFDSSPLDPKYGQMDKSLIGEIPASGVHHLAAAKKYED
jgi:hypothetical protein